MLNPRPPLPTGYLDRMGSLLGDDYHAFVQAYNSPPFSGLRANTLKIAPQELLVLTGFELTPVRWCAAGYYLGRDTQAGKHPYHQAGLYYLQEPTAMLAAELLAPQPGDRVLDLAAAPGGKSTHLASLMNGQGILVANEIHPGRVWELAENLERWGATNALITNETPERLAEHFGPYFDRVLLDAPYSGEGMFRKNEQARLEWTEALVHSCALRQGRILAQAAQMVRPGGHLLYSTCTFSPEENEGVIASYLEQHPDYEIVSTQRQPGFSPGIAEWLKPPPSESTQHSLSQATRLWPHRVDGEGHFYALLRRTGAARSAQFPRRGSMRIPPEVLRSWKDFSRSTMRSPDMGGTFCYHGTYLYQCPEHMAELGNLRTIHHGVWLGSLKNNRFVPAHYLAMSLNPDQVFQSIHLSVDDRRLSAYLRGETFPSPGDDGWVLVCTDRFPVGWGKRVKGVMKNFYPRGLRRH